MNNQSPSPSVVDDEWLARFVVFSNWVRSDKTIRPDAFIPYPWPNLSVTRHLGLTHKELWAIGEAVADSRPATLYGRADVQAVIVKRQALSITPTREPRNHANISGWPPDKPSQKIIAQEIAAANFIPCP
jgi:hypothetical protein